MLSVLFTILMIGIFGKLIGFAFHAAWGLTKVVCTLVVLPVVLIVLVVAGFVALALPVLVIVGIVALGMGVFSRRWSEEWIPGHPSSTLHFCLRFHRRQKLQC